MGFLGLLSLLFRFLLPISPAVWFFIGPKASNFFSFIPNKATNQDLEDALEQDECCRFDFKFNLFGMFYYVFEIFRFSKLYFFGLSVVLVTFMQMCNLCINKGVI